MIELYSDVNCRTPLQSEKVVNISSIYQSIYSFFRTSPKERLFNPSVGYDLEDLLHEVIEQENTLAPLNSIVSRLRLFEPRIDIDFSKSSLEGNADEYSVTMTIVFKLSGIAKDSFKFIAKVS